jgi:hypothetical protein
MAFCHRTFLACAIGLAVQCLFRCTGPCFALSTMVLTLMHHTHMSLSLRFVRPGQPTFFHSFYS